MYSSCYVYPYDGNMFATSHERELEITKSGKCRAVFSPWHSKRLRESIVCRVLWLTVFNQLLVPAVLSDAF